MGDIKKEYEKDTIKATVDFVKSLGSDIRVQNLVESYERILVENYPQHVKSYKSRLVNQHTSALAEAVSFHFFKSTVDQVQVKEIPNIGGVDFECKIGESIYIAEITSITDKSVKDKSGLEDDLTKIKSVGSYSGITEKLCNIVNSKKSQMSGYDCPAILVIATTHPQGDAVLDSLDAENLLVGDVKIGVSIPSTKQIEEGIQSVTDFEYSCFLQCNQEWDTCNRSVSAVLLVHISGVSAFILGLLHPDPEHVFSPKLLPTIPFVRLKEWPPKDNRLQTEWVRHENVELVIPRPKQQYRFWYDPDLRN